MLAEGTLFVEIALVIFMVIFVAIVGWVLLSRPGKYRRAARIPLDDDVVTRRDGGAGAPANEEDDKAKEHAS